MRKLVVLVLMVFSTLNVFAQSNSYRAVAPNRLNKEVNAQKNSIQVVDVRSEKEFKEKHIQSALNMNVNDSTFSTQILQLDRKSPVYLYCRTGKRSETAAKILIENGFENVNFLRGGIEKWEKRKRSIVRQK